MDHIDAKVYICCYCREQVENQEEGTHYHEGQYWPVVDFDVTIEDFEGRYSDELDRVKHQFIEEREQARLEAELEAMEAEWLQSAPKEQIEALEAQRERHKNFGLMMKDLYVDPIIEELNKPSPLLFALQEDERSQEQKWLDSARSIQERVAEAEWQIQLFEAKGPERVPFWKIQELPKTFASLESEADELIKSMCNTKTED